MAGLLPGKAGRLVGNAPGAAVSGLFSNVYRGRRVLLTGHTGFKGSWLTLWLSRLGAELSGFSLEPPTSPSLFAMSVGDRIADRDVGVAARAESRAL